MRPKKQSKKWLWGLLIIVFIGLIFFVYKLFNPSASDTKVNLSLFEKRWIETNKNRIIGFPQIWN